MIKFQIPNPKFQTNYNTEIPMTKTKFVCNFDIRHCILFVICNLCIGLLLSGCEQLDSETLNKITQEDPAFKEVLAKKQELDSRIGSLSSQLRDLKAETYTKIRTIQEAFDKQKAEIDSRITVLKKELEPARLKIRQEIETLRGIFSERKEMLKGLEGTKRNLTNLINQQKAVSVTAEEMSKWQERLGALNKQIEPLLGEIRELEEKLRVLRLKLIVLRQ